MQAPHFQEEETYLFSSLLGHIRELSTKRVGLTTKCSLAIFWRIYGDKQVLKPLLEDIEAEIKSYNPDPTRESNRVRKVFACASYKAITQNYSKAKHVGKTDNYLSYAKNSRDWLGQPRIACCLSFLDKSQKLGKDAKKYLSRNFDKWLSEGRDDFICIALLALRRDISKGDLQKTLEHVKSKISDLSLNVISLYLAGLSQTNLDLAQKATVEDNLYEAIREKLITFPTSPSSFENEEKISAATALFVSKYHKISGYYERYSSELKETLSLKSDFVKNKKAAKTRNLLLCVTSIFSIGLLCLIFFLPSFVEFGENPSAFGRFLLKISTKKYHVLLLSLVLTAYILISYLKRGDPVFGIFEFVREKYPGLFKSIKGEEGKKRW